jgi:hypothetical protein
MPTKEDIRSELETLAYKEFERWEYRLDDSCQPRLRSFIQTGVDRIEEEGLLESRFDLARANNSMRRFTYDLIGTARLRKTIVITEDIFQLRVRFLPPGFWPFS